MRFRIGYRITFFLSNFRLLCFLKSYVTPLIMGLLLVLLLLSVLLPLSEDAVDPAMSAFSCGFLEAAVPPMLPPSFYSFLVKSL